MNELPTMNAFWVGSRLGGVARACLASFLRHGHPVVLHCHERIVDVPPGVVVVDAGETVPLVRMVTFARNLRLGVYTDLFRFEIIRQGKGMWIDCDMYCVAPVALPDAYVFGYEDINSVGSAIIGLPQDAALLEPIIGMFAERSPVPPWMKLRDRCYFAARRKLGIDFNALDLRWGTTGPAALTWLARDTGIIDQALPIEVFYPLHYKDCGKLLSREWPLERLVTANTLAMHLWNDQRARWQRGTPEPGSVLEQLQREAAALD